MNYAKALCCTIPSLPSDPNKDKKFSYMPVTYQPFCLIYNQQEFPALPSANSKTASNSPTPCNSNISTVRSFSSDEQHPPSTPTSSIIAPTVDLAALKAEIKQEIKKGSLKNSMQSFIKKLLPCIQNYSLSVSNHPQKSCLIPKQYSMLLLKKPLQICMQDLILHLINCMNPSGYYTNRFKFMDKLPLLNRSLPRESEMIQQLP